MPRTEYFEARVSDEDVAIFLVQHSDQLNIWHLPVKVWAAREDGKIVAVMTLTTRPYIAIDLIIGDPGTRPFMRILRLWKIAERWLSEKKVPAVAAPIKDYMAHFQMIVQRLGFKPGGQEIDEVTGEPVETIFIKEITPAEHVADPSVIH